MENGERKNGEEPKPKTEVEAGAIRDKEGEKEG